MADHRITPSAEVVLLGAGHSHLEVIKKYGELNEKPFRLTLVNQCCWGLYKGMLGKVIRKVMLQKEAAIDLGHFCQQNQVRFVCQEISSVDIFEKLVYTSASLLALHFDVASFDLGLAPSEFGDASANSETSLSPWPPDQFLKKLIDLEVQIRSTPEKIRSVLIAGGDFFSAELAFSLKERFEKDEDLKKIGIRYLHLDPVALATYSRAWKILIQRFKEDDIAYSRTESVDEWNPEKKTMSLHDGSKLSYDLLIPAYARQGHPLLQSSGLALDRRGLIRVNPNLESTSHPGIYAVGSSVAWSFPYNISHRHSYPVKMGAVLFHNLQKRFQGLHQIQFHEPWFKPEYCYCGKGKTLRSFKNFAGCKKSISLKRAKKDRKWLLRYATRGKPFHPPTYLESGNQAVEPCFGTGDQLPRGFIEESLTENTGDISEQQIENVQNSVPVRLTMTSEPVTLIQVTEYQRCFTRDYYTFSRVFSEHCISRMLAKGVFPTHAQSSLTVIYGPYQAMKRDLSEMCTGVLDAMESEGIRQIGGHTHAGIRAGMALSLTALVPNKSLSVLWNQKSLHEGLELILTKPLGTGIVLSGYLSQILSSEHYFKSIESMLQTHREAFNILNKVSPAMVTDIAGHGLAQTLLKLIGHDKNIGIRIDMTRVPTCPGVLKALKKGVRSGLHSQNRIPFTRCLQPLDNQIRNKAELLFDPQTSGPLLIGIEKGKGDMLVDRLTKAGYLSSAVIGQTVSVEDSAEPSLKIC